MIYFDNKGHMVADSWSELHEFAINKLEMKKEWFQIKFKNGKNRSHYDLTTENMKRKAENFGAIRVKSSKIIEVLIKLRKEEFK